MSQRRFQDQDFVIRLKSGPTSRINDTANKNSAVDGELVFTTDTNQIYFFNGDEFEQINVREGSEEIIFDTEANILAQSPEFPSIGKASDTNEFFVWDTLNWFKTSISLYSTKLNPDAGYVQDSDKNGFGSNYITGRKLFNTGIGQFDEDPYPGAIRTDHSVDPPVFEIFLRGQWNRIFYDMTMERGEFQHIPERERIDIRSGNSEAVGLNNQPIVQGYKVDAGCYPRPTVLSGGNIKD
jgi:hypothetical protein